MALSAIEHRIFAYDCYVENNECYSCSAQVSVSFEPSLKSVCILRNTIMCRMNKLRARSTLMKRIPVGDP